VCGCVDVCRRCLRTGRQLLRTEAMVYIQRTGHCDGGQRRRLEVQPDRSAEVSPPIPAATDWRTDSCGLKPLPRRPAVIARAIVCSWPSTALPCGQRRSLRSNLAHGRWGQCPSRPRAASGLQLDRRSVREPRPEFRIRHAGLSLPPNRSSPIAESQCVAPLRVRSTLHSVRSAEKPQSTPCAYGGRLATGVFAPAVRHRHHSVLQRQ